MDAVALSDSTVTLTPAEYGNVVLPTWQARATAYIPLDPVAANIIGENAGLTMDTLASNVAVAGTNVRYGAAEDATAGRTNIDDGDTIRAADVRYVTAKLRGANVSPFDGTHYAGVIHPDVSVDLRTETGAAAWLDPSNYSAAEKRWNGEIGAFEGVRFMESPRAPLFANASDGAGAAGTVDVYATIIFGQQALAKAFSKMGGPNPRIVAGAVVDKLRRFQPLGWHHYVAYGRFREAALWRIETSSSIGAN